MSEDNARKVIRVSADSEKAIKVFAERKSLSVGDAADTLIATAVSRLNALARYAKNKEPQPPGKPKKSAKQATKKAVVTKSSKASKAAKAAKKAKREAAAVVEAAVEPTLNGASAHA